MHQSQRTVTSRSPNHADAFSGERRDTIKPWKLKARHIRVALVAIDYYAKYGASPPLKYLAVTVYGRYRKIIENDVKTLVAAGVLKMDRQHGVRTLRPAPAFRLVAADEIMLEPGMKGALVRGLKLQLQQLEGYHNA